MDKDKTLKCEGCNNNAKYRLDCFVFCKKCYTLIKRGSYNAKHI